MKLLLDENLPHQLRVELIGHEAFTTAYMGWMGVENGKLLAKAADQSFDALLTTDRGMEYEQNLGKLPLSIVIIEADSNAIEDIRPLIPKIQAALTNLQPKSLVRIATV
jgi:hypothetical protein